MVDDALVKLPETHFILQKEILEHLYLVMHAPVGNSTSAILRW